MIGCVMRRLLLLLLLAISQIGAAPASAVAPVERPIAVPLVALLANPERFDGKLVAVEGFLNLEFEGDAIYSSRSDFDAMLLGNAIWVDGPKFEEPAARRALSGRHVDLTGRFDADMHGHFGMFAGGFVASDIQVRLTRDQIRATMVPVYGNLPWPLMILVLLPSSAALAIALAIQSRRSTVRPGALLTGSALLIAGAIGVFSICRLWDFPLMIPSLVKVGYGWMAPPLLVEFVIGAAALVASGLFAFRRNLLLCVVFASAQLIVPAIIEARAFRILEVPFSIYSAKDQNYRWKRTGPPPPEGRVSGPDWIDPFAY